MQMKDKSVHSFSSEVVLTLHMDAIFAQSLIVDIVNIKESKAYCS